MQCFFTSWNSPKCHSRKDLNCQVHQNMRKLMIQLDKRCSVSSHHGIPISVIQEKKFNRQVHEDMKLNAGL